VHRAGRDGFDDDLAQLRVGRREPVLALHNGDPSRHCSTAGLSLFALAQEQTASTVPATGVYALGLVAVLLLGGLAWTRRPAAGLLQARRP
jgi:hypothetical protein